MKTSSQKGFTLAELLIALALLGVIAAFTIPKVLQATGTQENAAKLKETVSSLESAWYNMKLQNTFTTGSTLAASIDSGFNSTIVDPAASAFVAANNGPMSTVTSIHPCGGTTGVTSEAATYASGYLQFPNGVVVMGLGSGPNLVTYSSIPANGGNTSICIDVNGPSAPNQLGSDVFVGEFNQWGNFDGTGTISLGTANQLGTGDTAYPGSPSPSSKNFNWGAATVATANAGCITKGGAANITYNATTGAASGGPITAVTGENCATGSAWIGRAGNMLTNGS